MPGPGAGIRHERRQEQLTHCRSGCRVVDQRCDGVAFAVLREPGDGLAQEVSGDLRISEWAKASGRCTAGEEGRETGVVRALALVDTQRTELGMVDDEALDEEEQQPVPLDEAVELVDDPRQLLCGVAARATSSAPRNIGNVA